MTVFKPNNREKFLNLVQKAAAAFFNADVNHDHQLSWEDWQLLFPDVEQVSSKEMRAIFDMADANSSGYISRDEFFFWVLNSLGEQ